MPVTPRDLAGLEEVSSATPKAALIGIEETLLGGSPPLDPRPATGCTLARLGRSRVHAGRVAAGERLLHEAVELATDPYEAARAHALIAEARVLAGRATDALELVALVPPAGLEALLARITGLALAQLGHADDARRELERAQEAARASGDEIELVHALDALCRVNALGSDQAGRSRERDALVRRLGVVLPTAPVAAFPPAQA